jgi:hypothetical protein
LHNYWKIKFKYKNVGYGLRLMKTTILIIPKIVNEKHFKGNKTCLAVMSFPSISEIV